jgi:hypothetical protein
MKTYQLTVTEEQAVILSRACELIARCHMPMSTPRGLRSTQIAEELVRRMEASDAAIDDDDMEELRDAFLYVIGLYKIDHNNAFDLYQVIRHRLAYDRLKPGEKPGIQVEYQPPFRMGSQPLAKIECVESVENGKTVHP